MMHSIDPNSAKNSNEIDSQCDQVNLSSFSQSTKCLSKETSFIEQKNGPSVLLKHIVRKTHSNSDLQKSTSVPFLVPTTKTVDSTDAKLFPGYLKCDVNNYLTITPNLQNNLSNHLLTSTPNLYSSSSTVNQKQKQQHHQQQADNNDDEKNESKKFASMAKYFPVIHHDAPSPSTWYPPAIQVRNVSFNYQDYDNSTNVLKNVNLTCAIGSIYGLLGPSGCGKTTLIKLMLSKYRPIRGEINAFGYNVDSKYSGMIGSGVGYMPQETALIFDFTIEEHLTYFGRLYFMPYDKIKKRIDYMCKTLDLPEKTRLVHNLSGGQQHRVSFACALIHKPRLLILDEPTVGLDPILRERIWHQLLTLARNNMTTILITTHYIEEAKRADMIGFLREGRLLVEQTPQYLMKKYETNSLETIFFRLCLEQQDNEKLNKSDYHVDVNFHNSVNEMIEKRKSKSDSNSPVASTSSSPDLNELKLTNDYKNECDTTTTRSNSLSEEKDQEYFRIPWIDRNKKSEMSKWFIQLFAIILKYFILTKRRPETILAQYVLPIVAISAFCVCIGSTPSNIRLGIVNEENCGFPYDMNQNFTMPPPENSVQEFMARFERFIGLSNSGESGGEKVKNQIRINLNKRSIEDLTTLAPEMMFEEEEATTVYPSKFNLMNNLNFNENRNGVFGEQDGPKSFMNDEVSVDRLISNLPDKMTTSHSDEVSTTVTNNTLYNHRLTTNELISNNSSSSTTESLNENVESETEAPLDASEEDNEALFDEEMKSNHLNSQFENACFSQDLIRKMNGFIFNKIPYDSHAKAIEDVRAGKIWGVLRIRKGFSRALVSKILFQDYGDVNINDSLVEINADMTNNALTITLEVTLSRLYPEFVKEMLVKANHINFKSNTDHNTTYKFYNLNSGRLPIILGSHVFKNKFTLSDYFGIREFAAPGLLIILTYSVSYALTVFSLVTEIGDKMFDRHQCIGLTSNQLIFSHLFTRFVFSATGTVFVVLLSIYFFDIANHGSFITAITLLLLQSYCAMTHGMLISALCPSLFICASISNGYLFFVFIISGVLWSFETLPTLMKHIGVLLPSTIPCESLRTIMTRGQGFESNIVVLGFAITIIWIFIHYIATIIVFNYRKNSK